MRSSSEWNAITTSRPPGLRMRSAAGNARASSPSSSLTKMRSAWNVRVAGWMSPGLARTTRATMSASCRVERIGASLRALTIARATPRACRSSPSVAMMVARSRSEATATTSAALTARPPHAHVERPVAAEGKSALGLVELHGGDADVEQHAVDGGKPNLLGHPVERRKVVLDEVQPAARGLDQVGAERDRALVAVDADDLRIRRREDEPAVAARAEGAVDVDAAVAHVEQLDRGAAEHGTMRGRSASDSREAVAPRHRSRAPSASCAALRDPNCFRKARTFPVASVRCARKRSGSQI